MDQRSSITFVAFYLFFSVTSAFQATQLYGTLLDPLQIDVVERKNIDMNLSVDFPVIKVLIGQTGKTPVLCEVQTSTPDITGISSFSLGTAKTLVKILPVNNYAYIIYNDASIDILQNNWNANKNINELTVIASIPKPSSLPTSLEGIEVIYSKEKETFQLWTKNAIFIYKWDSSKASLSFVSSVDIPSSMKGIDNWVTYQVEGGYVYIVYKDKTDRVIVNSIESSYTDSSKAQIEIVLPASGDKIIDFQVAANFLYIAQANQGLYVYNYASQSQTWTKVQFISEPTIQYVTGTGNIIATVCNATQSQHFEIKEYTKVISANTFQENSNRVFSGIFTGDLKVDDMRVLLLSQNVMFVWYHSVSESIQSERDKLISSFVFYGATGFAQETSPFASTLIYTKLDEKVNYYQVSNTYPKLTCNIKDLQSQPDPDFYYNLEFTGVTCPLKVNLRDYSADSICLYHQKLTISLSSSVYEGIKWGWVVLIGFGFSIVFVGIGVLVYYLIKYKRDSQIVYDRLYSTKDPQKPSGNTGNTGNNGNKSSSSFINDASLIGDSFAPFRNNDRSEIRDDSRLDGKVLSTQQEDTLRTGLSNSPVKPGLEDIVCDIREEQSPTIMGHASSRVIQEVEGETSMNFGVLKDLNNNDKSDLI